MNPLKPAQSHKRRTFHLRELEIDLHHLVARNLSRVSHRDVSSNRLIGSDRLCRDDEIGVAEFRVAQSVAKRI